MFPKTEKMPNRLQPNSKRRSNALFLVVVVFVLFFPASFVVAKTKLLEAITMRASTLVVSSKVYLNGVIKNTKRTNGKDNPVTIQDNVNVNGTLSAKNLEVSGSSPFLKDVNCAEGSILQKNGDGWACGVDDASDILATLNCTEGQVPMWRSGAWVCNSNAGATGPKGDKGDVGATGATGATGTTGATGATGASACTDSSNPTNPFQFAYVGNTKNVRVANTSLAANGSLTLFSVATGNTGVIRNIHLVTDMSGNTRSQIMNVSFNIKYDGESSPSVSVPLGSLIGWEDPTRMTNVSTTFKTPFFSVNNHGPSGLLGSSFTLRYPIPYTNGITVYLTANASATTQQWWSNIFYQDSLATDCWNSNLRFFASRSNQNVAASVIKSGTVSTTSGSGTVTGSSTNFLSGTWVGNYLEISGVRDDAQILSVESATSLTVAAEDVKDTVSGQTYYLATPHTLFSRAVGKRGWIAAINTYAHPAAFDMYYLEANIRFFVNQETTPSLLWSGVEDYAASSFYFETKFQDDTGGIVSFDGVTTGNTDFYRLFYDHPLRYTNGIAGKIPNLSDQIVTMNWTTVYYEET